MELLFFVCLLVIIGITIKSHVNNVRKARKSWTVKIDSFKNLDRNTKRTLLIWCVSEKRNLGDTIEFVDLNGKKGKLTYKGSSTIVK